MTYDTVNGAEYCMLGVFEVYIEYDISEEKKIIYLCFEGRNGSLSC